MSNSTDDADALRAQLTKIRAGIREVVHDINNPLGILRLAAYYLSVAHPEEDKRDHYCAVINENVEKLDSNLKRLRALAEPRVETPQEPPPDSATQ